MGELIIISTVYFIFSMLDLKIHMIFRRCSNWTCRTGRGTMVTGILRVWSFAEVDASLNTNLIVEWSEGVHIFPIPYTFHFPFTIFHFPFSIFHPRCPLPHCSFCISRIAGPYIPYMLVYGLWFICEINPRSRWAFERAIRLALPTNHAYNRRLWEISTLHCRM